MHMSAFQCEDTESRVKSQRKCSSQILVGAEELKTIESRQSSEYCAERRNKRTQSGE